jgi:WS/DGAT/MGAT family acyltransferase
MERLSALDATFLELEQADAGAHMHIGAVLVFEPQNGARPPSLEDIRTRLTERLDALPRYRQRLSTPEVGGLRFPTWEPDPGFRIEAHVTRAALPAPGGASELLDWAGDFYSHRLDRTRPLWRLVLLEGLEGDRWALCTKTHHSLADGVGSIDAGLLLLDGADAIGRAWRPPPHTDGSLLTAPLRAARAGVHALQHPAATFERSAALAELLVRDELVAAPHTSLNVPLGTHRRLATVGVPLDDLRAIKTTLGGTINDVVLSAVAGGLRALLLARGEVPGPGGLRAMVPVDVRTAAERLSLGNRISSLFVRLPVDVEDPIERHEQVRREASALKASGQAVGSSTLLDLAQHAPPLLHAVVARSLFATRLFNVTVTNVPGPQVPMHAFGSRLRDAVPIVPLAADHALAVAVLSADGRVVFCLNCDRDAVPDAHVAAAGIAETIDRLHAAAAPPAAP